MAALLEQSGRVKPQRAACEREGEAVETRSMVFELVLACSLLCWTGLGRARIKGHKKNKYYYNMYRNLPRYYNLKKVFFDFL